MKKLFYKDKPIIGLDISSTDMKVMSIDLKRQAVLGYGNLDLDPLRIKKLLMRMTTTCPKVSAHYWTKSLLELWQVTR